MSRNNGLLTVRPSVEEKGRFDIFRDYQEYKRPIREGGSVSWVGKWGHALKSRIESKMAHVDIGAAYER